MTKNERLELNQLSKEAYGKSSRWQKVMLRGEVGPQIEILEDGTERKYKGLSYFSIEQMKTKMLDLIKENEVAKAAQEKEALEQKTKQEEKNKEIAQKVEETKQETLKTILETVEG